MELFLRCPVLLLCVTLAATIQAQTIRYVKQGGSGDGSSWENASGDLQGVINASAAGGEVWVAAGEYQRAVGQSFSMREGVKIYGGFPVPDPGNPDPKMEDRSWSANETVLRGNGNSVVTAEWLSLASVLDGFTLTGGSAATVGGGGIRNSSASPTLANLVIRGNTIASSTAGGGIRNLLNSSPMLINVLITANGNSSAGGGGMFNGGGSSPVLINVTISGNSGSTGFANDVNCFPRIYNSIIYNNGTINVENYGGAGIDPSSANNIIQGVAGHSPDVDPLFASTDVASLDFFRLQPGSPALNAGKNAVYTGANMDLAGNSRIRNNTIDLGAYEYQQGNTVQVVIPSAANVIYVKKGGTGRGNSWTAPLGDLAEALDWAAGSWDAGENDPLQIWVAFGTYSAPGSGSGGGFRMANNVAIYGGFTGEEATLEERDWEANATILSGGGITRVVTNIFTAGDRLDETAVLDGFTLTGGAAIPDGGGMCNQYASPTLKNVTISGNEVANTGGGMYNAYSSPMLTNVIISGNRANSFGGGMYNINNSSPTLTDVTISGNRANGFGGGMYNGSSSTTLTNVTISGNSANSGGGMYNSSSSSTLTNVAISDNSANSGGGMYNELSSPRLIDVTISGNEANSDGGGIYNGSTSSPMLTDVTINDNLANNGGGMYNTNNSSPTLMNVTISMNEVGNNGGGMYNFSSSPKLTNMTISGNEASSNGGGLYNVNSSSPKLTNVTISGNEASNGGGMYNVSSSPMLTNMTISGNEASSNGGGLYNGSSSSFTLINSIVWNNSSGVTNESSSNSTYSYSLVQELTDSDDGNISSDGIDINGSTVFVAPVPYSNAPTTDGNYSLQAGAPVINVGSNELLWEALRADADEPIPEDPEDGRWGTDPAGTSRIVGGRVDLGAYENPSAPISPDAGNILYVDVNVEDSDGSGDSWGNALPDLSEALDWAADNWDAGENDPLQIWVASGTYMAPVSGFRMANNVAIYGGFTGEEDELEERDWEAHPTILSGGGTTRAVNNRFTADNPLDETAVLDGFTLTGGAAVMDGGGMYNQYASPTLTNVTISGNEVAGNGGGIYNFSSSPTLANVTISNNSANGFGGGMYDQYASPTLTNVTISGNEAASFGGGIYNGESSSTLTNVTISGNAATFGGGIFNGDSSPTLTNVTISGNVASFGGGIFNGDSSPTLTNSIVWGNSSNGVFDNGSSNSTYAHSLVQGLTDTDNGNISSEGIDADGSTVFVAPVPYNNAPTTDGDYRLQSGSPAINVGNNAANTSAHDIAGNERIVGNIIDLGAYESAHEDIASTGSGSFAVAYGTTLGDITVPDEFTVEVTLTGGQSAAVGIDADPTTWLLVTAPAEAADNYNSGIAGDYVFYVTPTLPAHDDSQWFTNTQGLRILVTVTVDRGTPVITWPDPDPITYGTALSGDQLNATSIVPGTFAYDPAANTVLNAGPDQVLSVSFTPDDTDNYETATAVARIDVLKAMPVITWPDPDPITYGTALGEDQLNATADVPGTFTYDPAANTVLNAGSDQVLQVSFTPDDTDNYGVITAEVWIDVLKAMPVITWPDPDPITYGTALGEDQLNATASVPGTFSYSFELGHLLDAGTHTLTVSLVPDDTDNYEMAMKDVQLKVNKAPATLSLSGLLHTYDGSGKAVTVTTAPADLTGVTVTYDGSATLPTEAGSYAVVAKLTHDNYEAADATGTLVIGKATATLSLSGLLHTYDGSGKAVTVTTTPADLTGVTVTYDGSATLPTEAGSYAVVAKLTHDNYEATDVTGTLVIGKAMATLSLSGLLHTYDGSGKAVTVTTAPADLTGVTVTYDGSAVPPTEAGNYAVVATLTHANYEATEATGTLVIGKATATLTLSDLNHTYDGTGKPATVTTSPADLTGVSVTYDGSAVPPTEAGEYEVVATLTHTNYEADAATGTLVINKAAATLTLSDLTHTYDGTGKPVTATTAPADLTGVSVTYDGSAVPPAEAGEYEVVATLTHANYEADAATGTLVIGKAAATLTLSDLNHTYDGTGKAATVTTSPAGLTGVSVTYDGLAVPPTEAGEYEVVATLTHDNYEADAVTGTLVIGKAAATLTLSDLNRTYDGTARPATVTTSPAGLTGVSVTYDGSAVPPAEAGEYEVVATLTHANYEATEAIGTLVIGKATATLTLSDLNHTYDGTGKPATVTTSPADLTGVSVTYDGSATLPTEAGSYAVVATLTHGNYEAADVTGTLVIGKAPATLSLSGLLHTYDSSGKAVTVTTAPADLTGIMVTYDGETALPTEAGSYAVEATLTHDNYEAEEAIGVLVIRKATATLVLSDLLHTYDGGGKSVTVTTAPADLTGVTVTYDGSATLPTEAGSYAVVATLTHGNYEAEEATGTLVIGKAPATLTLSNLLHTYDGSGKSVTVTTAPAELTGVTVTYDGETVLPVDAGEYEVVATLTHANYEAEEATGTLVIGKAPATLTLSNLLQTYDGSGKSVTVTTAPADLTGVTVTYDGSATLPTEAGSYAVVATLTHGNYEATDTTGTLVIGKAPATLSLSGLLHTYDGSGKSVTVTTSPADLTGVTVTYDGETVLPVDAGEYEVVATLTHANYEAEEAIGMLVIGKAPATLTLSNLIQTYDGTAESVTVTTSPADLTGVTVTYDGETILPVDAGEYEVVATLTHGNYEATDATGTLVIGKATAKLTLSNLMQTYDGSSKSVTVTTSPADLTGVTVTYDGETILPVDAGEYEVVATLTRANYEAEEATVTLVIRKAMATLTLSNLLQTYDGTAESVTVTTSPVDLKGVTVTYDGEATPPTEAGNYTVKATLTHANYEAEEATGALTIGKAQSVITAEPTQTHIYDGKAKAIAARVTPAELQSHLQYSPQRSFTEVGQHRVRVYLNESANYLSAETWVDFSITSTSQQNLTLPNRTVTYDGQAYSLSVEGLSPDVTVVYTGNGQTDAGSHTVTALVSRPNYADTTLTGILYINKATTVITAEAIQEYHYDGTTKAVQATLNHSEGELVYTPQRAYMDAGTYMVTVSVPETANHHGASAAITLWILPAPQAGLTLPSHTVTYNGRPHSLSVQGLPEDATVVYTGNGGIDAGEYEVTAVVSRANHVDTILTAILTIERAQAFILGDENQVYDYDGTNKGLDVSLSHSEATLVYDPRRQFTEAGIYIIIASAPQTRNYRAVSKTFTLRIDPAARALNFRELPEKTYGDGNFLPGAVASSGEEVSYTSSNSMVAEIVNGLIHIRSAGRTTIKATVPENSNYSSSPQVSRELVVHKRRQVITFNAPTEAGRDAGTVQLEVSTTSGLPVVLSVDDPQVATLEGNTLHIHRLGSVRITAAQEGDGNYEPAEPVTATIQVVDLSSDFPVRVHPAVSVNGDGINEFLLIEGIRDYPENKVTVFNRNGTIVYEAEGYDNDRVAFRGSGTGRLRVPAGTYFYTVEVKVDGRWEYRKGYFALRY